MAKHSSQHMIGWGNKFQILNPIVIFDAILMVDFLHWQKATIKMLCHYQAVFKHIVFLACHWIKWVIRQKQNLPIPSIRPCSSSPMGTCGAPWFGALNGTLVTKIGKIGALSGIVAHPAFLATFLTRQQYSPSNPHSKIVPHYKDDCNKQERQEIKLE